MGKKTKRAQTPKARNIEYMKGMQELRRSNASGPHRSGVDYKRKPKHTNRPDWEN